MLVILALSSTYTRITSMMTLSYRDVGGRVGAAGRVDKVEAGDVDASVTKVSQVELVHLLPVATWTQSPVALGYIRPIRLRSVTVVQTKTLVICFLHQRLINSQLPYKMTSSQHQPLPRRSINTTVPTSSKNCSSWKWAHNFCLLPLHFYYSSLLLLKLVRIKIPKCNIRVLPKL